MRLFIDEDGSEAPEGWETFPYADRVVHFDPTSGPRIEAIMLIDDSLNSRNDDITDVSIETLDQL